MKFKVHFNERVHRRFYYEVEAEDKESAKEACEDLLKEDQKGIFEKIQDRDIDWVEEIQE